MQEPQDGDFVAYIEALQRESAARLAKNHINVNLAAAAPAGSAAAARPVSAKASGHFFEDKTATKPAALSDLDQTIERLFRGQPAAALVKAAIAAFVGALAMLVWLARGGTLPFLVGIALLAYSVPRLLARFRAAASAPANHDAVQHVFGKSGKEP